MADAVHPQSNVNNMLPGTAVLNRMCEYADYVIDGQRTGVIDVTGVS